MKVVRRVQEGEAVFSGRYGQQEDTCDMKVGSLHEDQHGRDRGKNTSTKTGLV